MIILKWVCILLWVAVIGWLTSNTLLNQKKMSKQAELNKREKETIEAFSKLGINHWGISNEYAEQIVPMIPGKSTTNDFDKQIDIQLAYQEGMFKMFKLLNQNKDETDSSRVVNGTIGNIR